MFEEQQQTEFRDQTEMTASLWSQPLKPPTSAIPDLGSTGLMASFLMKNITALRNLGTYFQHCIPLLSQSVKYSYIFTLTYNSLYKYFVTY